MVSNQTPLIFQPRKMSWSLFNDLTNRYNCSKLFKSYEHFGLVISNYYIISLDTGTAFIYPVKTSSPCFSKIKALDNSL